jgi:hypothetical protein
MLPLGFGGHPALHRYNALLERSRQARCEIKYRTQTQKMQDLHTKKFYHKWACGLGACMVFWGQALTRFGATDKNFLLP